MLKRVARSIMYRAFGLLCYDPGSEKVVAKELLAVSPDMRVIDPARFGIYEPSIERVVAIEGPVPFDLDSLPRKANGNGTNLLSDRYSLALAMLPPGTGVCLDACTSDPEEKVRSKIQQLGYTYLAIDILSARGVQQEDLTKLSFSDDSIASIISCDTIEHIPDYGKAVAELHRVLAPAGIAILHFPVYYFDRPTGIPIVPGADPWDHVRYFSVREMLELFDRVGFAVLRAHLNFDYGALLVVLTKLAVNSLPAKTAT